MEFFKPEDFDYKEHNGVVSRIFAAKTANRILKERGVPVYGGPVHDNHWSRKQYDHDDRRALLVCIETIPKEQDSADKILLDALELAGSADWCQQWTAIFDRAKKILEGK